MTTELEKQFFDTFGIEPKLNDCNWQCQKPSKLIYMCANNNNCEHCKEYPQITDRILLELICINNSCAFEQKTIIWEEVIMPTSYKYLKESVLSLLMLHRKDFSKLTHQVQQLFKESEQE